MHYTIVEPTPNTPREWLVYVTGEDARGNWWFYYCAKASQTYTEALALAEGTMEELGKWRLVP